MTERPANSHVDCREKACVCPKCSCGHRLQMHAPVRGCRVITELRHKTHEDNILCGCKEGCDG